MYSPRCCTRTGFSKLREKRVAIAWRRRRPAARTSPLARLRSSCRWQAPSSRRTEARRFHGRVAPGSSSSPTVACKKKSASSCRAERAGTATRAGRAGVAPRPPPARRACIAAWAATAAWGAVPSTGRRSPTPISKGERSAISSAASASRRWSLEARGASKRPASPRAVSTRDHAAPVSANVSGQRASSVG